MSVPIPFQKQDINIRITNNFNFIKLFGDSESNFLLYLFQKHLHFKNKKKLTNGMFYLTIKLIKEQTGYGHTKQNNILKKLKEFGLLFTKVIGCPPKTYYSMNEEKILLLIEHQDSLRTLENIIFPKTENHFSRNGKTILSNNIIISNNIIDISKDILHHSENDEYNYINNNSNGDNNMTKIIPVNFNNSIQNNNITPVNNKKIPSSHLFQLQKFQSKQLKSSAPPKPNYSSTALNLMRAWNRLPNIPKHKKEDSKVFVESCQLIDHLLNGTYKNKEIQEWLENKNIKFDFSIKRKSSEIRSWLKELAKAFDPILNNNHKKMPRTLPALIFNKWTKNGFLSWFFIAATQGIHYKKPLEDKYPEITERFEEEIFKRKLNFTEKQVLITRIEGIREYQDLAYEYNFRENHYNLYLDIWNELERFDVFMDRYFEFLQDYYKNHKPSASNIGIVSNNWKRFIDSRNDRWEDWRGVYNFENE